ncbi:MAG: DUF2207 domain-containing protein [Clostridia bacterium]|nr:DUF2207 domain-containing protein [Clostridia bacterium]
MKKRITVAVIGLCLALCMISLTACNTDKGELWLDAVKIEASLNENGNLNVSETWTAGFNSSEGYRNLYKTLNLYDAEFETNSQIIDVSVYDNDNHVELERADIDTVGSYQLSNYPNTFYAFPTGTSGYEIGVIMPSIHTGTRSYTFRYTLTDMVGAYSDTSVLYWKQFDEDFELFVSNYDCKIHLPNAASTEGTRAWFHTEAAQSNLEVQPNMLLYTASEIQTGKWVETRVAMPNALFTQLTKQSNEPKLNALIAEEQAWADEWAAKQRKQKILYITGVVFACFLLVAASGVVVFLNLKNKRAKGDYPKYIRDIPKEWSAGELGHLFYYYQSGAEKKNLRGRLLSATILELARRNYIEIIPAADGDYKIHVNAVSTAMAADLKPYESTLFRLLKRVEAWAQHEFTMDEFETYAKKNYSDIDSSINEFNVKSKDWFKRGNFVGNMSGILRGLSFAGIAMAGLGALLFVNGNGSFFTISMVISGVILLLGVPKLPKLNNKGEEEYFRSVALKQYMLDFSNLKEYDIPQLILWEEYLVYATMMNISKEVIKNLKLVYPEITKEMEQGGVGYRPTGSYLFTYLWLSHRMRAGTPVFDLGSRIERSMTNIRNTAQALKHPTNRGGGIGGGGFGGGGFGGGGGGFGGGGGGGRH